jgi:cardiolipin synthase
LIRHSDFVTSDFTMPSCLRVPALLATAAADGTAWWTWTYTVISVAAFVLALLSVPSVLIKRQGRPQSAMSWVLILFLLPLVGILCWWCFGRLHLERKRRKRRVATRQRAERLSNVAGALPGAAETDWEVLPVRRLPDPESEWYFPPTRENFIRRLVNADEAYPAMEEAIRTAQRYVHVMFYIWQNDQTGRHFRDLLIEAARRGAEVRLLLDAIGTYTLRRGFMRPLIDAGARVETFSPITFFRRSLALNFRNHRKLVLSDSGVAVIGGLNIGDEYKHRWQDVALEIRGPAVDHLQEIFADDWYFTTSEDFLDRNYLGKWHGRDRTPEVHSALCGVVASGPHTRINLMHEAFFIAINRAQERIRITTPYFVPDQTILAALRSAAFRGVDVQIIVPHKSDSWLATYAGRSYYPDLLRAGVRMYEYDGAFLHTKLALMDRSLSIVSSANMDIRSFRLNFELGCFIDSAPLVGDLDRLFNRYLDSSREVFLQDVENKRYLVRLAESAAHLASPLL